MKPESKLKNRNHLKIDITKYYELLEQWLRHYGYEKINVHQDAGADMVFKRSRIEVSKFGNVDAYVCTKYMKEGATGHELQLFSQKMYNLASNHRSGLPLGFGAMMVVYPLLVVDEISTELAKFLDIYCPKHWASAEFPSALDLNSGGLYYYAKTPVWGYAYYNGYRKEVSNLFSPSSWQKQTGQS